jgi:GTP-binding protein
MSLNLHNVEFIKSAASVDAVPRDGLPQIVFSGKSNVGKSSVINKLLNRKQFARVSATPGKTVHINYFLIDRKVYFVDLPGYGYAKVAKTEKARWSELMESFFRNPFYITRGVMIVDSRHKPTNDDIVMANWFKLSGCPLIVVANKVDKLKKSEIAPNMALIRETLELPDEVRIIEFSAEKGTNRDQLISEITLV